MTSLKICILGGSFYNMQVPSLSLPKGNACVYKEVKDVFVRSRFL